MGNYINIPITRKEDNAWKIMHPDAWTVLEQNTGNLRLIKEQKVM